MTDVVTGRGHPRLDDDHAASADMSRHRVERGEQAGDVAGRTAGVADGREHADHRVESAPEIERAHIRIHDRDAGQALLRDRTHRRRWFNAGHLIEYVDAGARGGSRSRSRHRATSWPPDSRP